MQLLSNRMLHAVRACTRLQLQVFPGAGSSVFSGQPLTATTQSSNLDLITFHPVQAQHSLQQRSSFPADDNIFIFGRPPLSPHPSSASRNNEASSSDPAHAISNTASSLTPPVAAASIFHFFATSRSHLQHVELNGFGFSTQTFQSIMYHTIAAQTDGLSKIMYKHACLSLGAVDHISNHRANESFGCGIGQLPAVQRSCSLRVGYARLRCHRGDERRRI